MSLMSVYDMTCVVVTDWLVARLRHAIPPHMATPWHCTGLLPLLPSPPGSHGVHLEMAATNTNALKFYHKLGFKVLDFEVDMATGEGLPPEDVLILGRQL